MQPFDPRQPCVSFQPPPRRRERRRATALHFVEQAGARFVVKSFAALDDGPGDAARREAHEMAGIEAFRRAGAVALGPAAGPFAEIELEIDGAKHRLSHALVFPFVDAPTLYDAIAEAKDPLPLLREAGARIHARHRRADAAEAMHSDGSAHNVFADWTWFDFCEPHEIGGLRELKAFEALRFISSVVEVSRPGQARKRIAAFCEGYADRDVLLLSLDHARMAEPHMRVRAWSRMIGRPDKLVRYWRGDTRMFRRVRTWDALDHALAT